MAGAFGDRMRQFEDEKDRWFRERSAQASRLGQDIENAGREAWNAATRTGIGLVARTPQELRALGARVLDGQRKALSTPGVSLRHDRQPSSRGPATLASQPPHLTKPTGGGGAAT